MTSTAECGEIGLHALAHPAVADAEDGQDTQEVKDLGYDRVLENVASCNEHLFDVVRCQQHQGVHQRVAMVDAENHGTVPWDILFPMYLKTAVRHARMPIDIRE